MSAHRAHACDWIFFDCFNTLIDDFDHSGSELGLGTLPAEAVTRGLFESEKVFIETYRRYRNDPAQPGVEIHFDERLRRVVLASHRAPERAEVHEIVDAFLQIWEVEYLELIRPTPGVDAMLDYWSSRKPLGVISNFFLPDYPQRFLERFKLRKHFKFVVDSAALGFRKPDTRIFHRAFELAGIPHHESHRVTYVGDRIDLDVVPSQRLGMQTLHFNRSRYRPEVECAPPDVAVIYDWSEFR
ncbi:MAG TPA: HAD family hydrolase [Opitutaceae bacterium]|nr:HAD family hydrolase [Opitutaceae bacterium]